MRVLIYGGGAREHAIADKISSSPLLSKLYLSKPNDGFSHLGEILEAANFTELAMKAKNEDIELLIVGPEEPLVQGIADEFKKVGILVIGPDSKWAMLEGSKAFAKDFMARNNIPTAKYKTVNDKSQIKETLDCFELPVVLKADGLAAGKGVAIADSREKAEKTLEGYLKGMFGDASKSVVVEEFLKGEEVSLISLWDGEELLPLIPARDYKRLLNNNEGPNTGGMGAYCPVDLTSHEQNEINDYIKTLKDALKRENADFSGIIYSGLILTRDGVKILEYNMRFGDPETQPLLTHLETDLLYLFYMTAKKRLGSISLYWNKGQTTCVVIAAEGYPENPKKGGEIKNIQEIQEKYGVKIFCAGVKKENGKLVANGGRVLTICKTNGMSDIYKAAKELEFEDKYYRTDINDGVKV